MSHLLGERLDVLVDSGLRRLIENVTVEFGTREEERSAALVSGVSAGQSTENVTFSDNVADLEIGICTATPSKNVVHASGKRKDRRSEAEAGCVLRPKVEAFEIGDGSDEVSVAFQSENERVNARKSCLSSDCADKTLTELGLSELEVMTSAKAQE